MARSSLGISQAEREIRTSLSPTTWFRMASASPSASVASASASVAAAVLKRDPVPKFAKQNFKLSQFLS